MLLADRPAFAFEIIYNGIKADNMIITACRTAESSVQLGGYTNSIASAFLKAGVKNIIGAFWPVDDTAGAILTNLFYSAYLKGNTLPAALCAAQLQLRQDKRFVLPHFWAPFAAFGLNYK